MNFENEIRNGHFVSSNMKQIWNVQINLAKELIRICNKHNLKVWATDGTLLGVIRHQGFIPWDDDMDFVMMREDYDKLIQLSNEFRYPYFLQNALTEWGYVRGHAQLRNINTSAILPSDIWQNFNQGIFIDIFVLDDMPDEIENWPNIVKELEVRLSSLRFRTYSTFAVKNLHTILRLVKSVFKYDRKSLRQNFIEIENIVRNWQKGKNGLVANVMFSYPPFNRPIRYKQWYDKTLWLPFEDIYLPVPAEYDKDLKACFGDNYMSPIKSPTMHGNVMFDVSRPYSIVLKEIKKSLKFKDKIKGFFIPRI